MKTQSSFFVSLLNWNVLPVDTPQTNVQTHYLLNVFQMCKTIAWEAQCQLVLGIFPFLADRAIPGDLLQSSNHKLPMNVNAGHWKGSIPNIYSGMIPTKLTGYLNNIIYANLVIVDSLLDHWNSIELSFILIGVVGILGKQEEFSLQLGLVGLTFDPLPNQIDHRLFTSGCIRHQIKKPQHICSRYCIPPMPWQNPHK